MVVLGGIVPNAIHYALHIKPVLEAGETAGNGKDGNATSADVAKKGDTASSSSSAVKKDSASTLSSVPATFKYHLPTKAQMGKIDIRLIVGAAIFGLGWGMTGTCLLPSVVNAGSAVFGLTQPGAPLLFLTAVIAGLGLGGLV
ncbi:hypothetical protein QFC19_001331 [Naganishia cerealis]|uniref:Uncharacterized protein n=1 Tax=Naganishia cerealis TaxID=610337 RepID=A0ACC2WJ83_9TREE|nr:hypothetical protein QFC19_001331 [Naganishia cerealis]